MYVSVALQTFAEAAAPAPYCRQCTPPPPPLSRLLQATEILRRIERFLNNDNDPDADTFLICYSGHGLEDNGEWCCAEGSYVPFEEVVDLWEVRFRSRRA